MNNEIEIEKTDLKEKKILKYKQNDLHDQFFFSERNQFDQLDNVKVFKDESNDQIKQSDAKRNQITRSKHKNYNYLIPPLTRIGSDKSSSDSSVSSEKNLITSNKSSTFSLSKRKPVGNLTPTKFEYLNKSSKQFNKYLVNSLHTNLDGNLSDNSNRSSNLNSPNSSSNRSTPDSQINRSHCSTTCFPKQQDAFNYKPAYLASNLFDSCPNLNIHKLIYNDKTSKLNSAFTFPAFSSANLALSTRNLPKNAKTSGFIVASSIYGQILVVICLVLFTAEIRTAKLPLHYFEIFFFYLYSGSIIFLLYVFIYLLRGVKSSELRTRESKFKKDKVSENEKSHGSIFLRIGNLGFGLGTMVYNGLEFGSYFEFGTQSPCHSIFLGINPLLQGIFTFCQMYFIFTYSRLMINKFKLIARIGLIHLVATNICTWIKILLKETLQTLHFTESSTSHSTLEELILPLKMDVNSRLPHLNASNPCMKENIMGTVLSDMSTYLYPFIVEYSLIGAAFLYVMWNNIGRLTNTFSSNKSSLNYNSQHLHHHSNKRNCPHLANQPEAHETTVNQRSVSGSVSPSLSVNHLNHLDNNQVLFNTAATNQMETNLNHNLLETNSSSCSPNQTTNTSITPTSNGNVNLISNIPCTPPANRSNLMINSHHLSNANQTSNPPTNNNSNALLLDNISMGSSRDSFNGKYSGHHLSYQVNSMYTNNLNMLNSTQSLYSCLGSSKGLFVGFLFLVISIISLIIFLVLNHHTNYHSMAQLINESSHSVLLVLSSISIIIAYFKISRLSFIPGINETADSGLRDILLRVAAFGLYTYSFFSLIAGALDLSNYQNMAVFVTSILSIVQISLQSLFINDIVCRKRSSSKQQVPQQIITFLMIVNFIFWILYTFEYQRVELSPVQLKVYGQLTWGVIVRITLPLSIFYRFHSSITFAEIHKSIINH